jgi:hypothetical protein
MPARDDHGRAGRKRAIALLALALIFGFGVEAIPGAGLGGELGAWLAAPASARRADIVGRQDEAPPPSASRIGRLAVPDAAQAPDGEALRPGAASLDSPAGATPTTRAR